MGSDMPSPQPVLWPEVVVTCVRMQGLTLASLASSSIARGPALCWSGFSAPCYFSFLRSGGGSEGAGYRADPMGLGLCGVHIPSLDTAQTLARQPGMRGAVMAAAWVVSQHTLTDWPWTSPLGALVSLLLNVAVRTHHCGIWEVIVNVPHRQDCGLPGSLRSVRAEVPKPSCAIETAGW